MEEGERKIHIGQPNRISSRTQYDILKTSPLGKGPEDVMA